MRIGIVLSSLPAYSETFFLSKIKALEKKGYEVILFTNYTSEKSDLRHEAGPKKVDGIMSGHIFKVTWALFLLVLLKPSNLIRLVKLELKERKSYNSILKVIYFNSHILKYNLDWLHFGFATLAIDKENLAKAIKANMAISIRGFDIAIYPLKFPGCYSRLWGKLDKIHVISDDLKQKLYKQGLNKDVELVKIPPAINVDKFKHKRLDFTFRSTIEILSVGRLHWKKGFEYGIRTMAMLKERGIKFKYTIVGGGEQEEQLKFMVHQLNLEQYIRFAGVVPHNEIIGLTKNADIYLQPSVQEGFCNAVLEAQAAGCFCIVSDAEGLAENVLDEQTGFVTKRRDVLGLADAICNAINLSGLERKNYILSAQNRVKREFRIQDQASRFVEFYESVNGSQIKCKIKNKEQKIGLILPDVPTYSETFFRNKIDILKSVGNNVLIFTQYSPLKYKGVIRGYFRSKYLFVQQVHSIFVILFLFVKTPWRVIRFIGLERLDKKGYKRIMKSLYYSAHILDKKIDWLHFGFATMILEKENIAKAIGAKVAVSFRGYDINVFPLKNPDCYSTAWNVIDKVHTISSDLYLKALNLGLNKNVSFQKICPAIDIHLFSYSQNKFIKKDIIDFVTIARLTWIKGLRYSIDAMRLLKEKGLIFRYFIIGDGVLNEELAFQISQLGLQNEVFLLGQKNKNEIAHYLRKAVIYIQPSLNEGFCNAILEAQASRCLCIGSDVGGLKENIIEGETGWLVPPRKPEELAKKIIEVNGLSDDKKYEITFKAVNRVRKEFSLERQKEQFIAFYQTQDEETATYI